MVVILTASTERKLLVGNDYKLLFDDNNAVSSKIKLHKSLITLSAEGGAHKNEIGSMHTHILADQPFMTSTDICTFLLYQDIFKLNKHVVVSEKWLSIFEVKNLMFVIVPAPKD
jgi:hypothetical protein